MTVFCICSRILGLRDFNPGQLDVNEDVELVFDI